MNEPTTSQFRPISGMIGDTGIMYRYVTTGEVFNPPHWHESMELIYLLNGHWNVIINGLPYELRPKQVLVINPEDVHAIYCKEAVSMFLVISLDLDKMEQYMSGFVKYPLFCIPSEIPEEAYDEYLKICFLLEELTELFMAEPFAMDMEAQGIILQIYAMLLRGFSAKAIFGYEEKDRQTMNRLHDVINYITEHYREPITLEQIAGQIGLGREAFCRFFKKNTGSSFMNYLNELRLYRIYDELLHTDLPIGDIAERNGFRNMKLFHKLFKKVYGGTPSEIRKKKTHDI